MGNAGKGAIIVVADDDAEDRKLIRAALDKRYPESTVVEVEDGEELLECLLCRSKFAHLRSLPSPGLVLLDLNMPRANGREALREMKSDPKLRKIPVVIFTTSRSEEHARSCYKSGADGHIEKPAMYEGFVEVLGAVHRFLLETVEASER